MYQSYYGLNAKPFQLRPDPSFFFPSKGHKRAMAYLEYGLSQGEGFITITGEVGAGKTTLVRNLFRKLESDSIIAAQIVNTHVDADDILRMVTAAFGLPFEGADKATLLTRLEKFFRQCDAQGKRALLVVDEAQNLTVRAIEELRMLSNFQTAEKSLLQTFLLGQPEFRKILHGDNMLQLRQRVTASYHLGAMDALETQAYIEHRLHTAGWHNDPSMNDDAMHAIYTFSGGIPRKINTLCDRLFLMGYLEEIHAFGATEVNAVISDIEQEFSAPVSTSASEVTEEMTNTTASDIETIDAIEPASASLGHIDERLLKMERSILSVLDALKKILSPTLPKNANKEKN